ncbi:MAG: carbonic anhydrase [Parachlamydia sp.]|nr:carbonic anhydrase [Parachlamydia sp.]
MKKIAFFLLAFAFSLFRPVSADVNEDQVNALVKLADGHRAFMDLHFKHNEEEFIRLVREGQNPQALFIGCSDSRVMPDLILGTKPGDLFVIRTAGNFVPPYQLTNCDGVSASLQFAVEVLNVKNIIVCGHSHCGAVQGLFAENPTGLKLLDCWLKFGEQAKQMTLKVTKPDISRELLYSTAEQISVIYQIENLMSYPFVTKRVNEGTLHLHAWYNKVESGEIFYYDPGVHQFKNLAKMK